MRCVPQVPVVSVAATAEQTAIWFYEQLHGATATYNISVAFRFENRVDASRLQRAVDVLVIQHSALRTRFYLVGGRLHQLVSPDTRVQVQVVPPKGELDAEGVKVVVASEIRQPFDIMDGPLVRVLLIHSTECDCVCLSVHHIVADGWSIEVML